MKILFHSVKLYFYFAPVLFITSIGITILLGSLNGINALALQNFFDGIEDAVLTSMVNNYLYIRFFLLAGVILGNIIIGGIVDMLYSAMDVKIRGALTSNIHLKASRLCPTHTENPEIYDSILKANGSIGGISGIVKNGIFIITSFIPYFIITGWYLVSLRPVLILAIFIIFVPVFATQLFRKNIASEWHDKSAPLSRQLHFYVDAITDVEYFKETRHLGGYLYFLQKIKQTFKKIAKLEWKESKHTNLLNFYNGVIVTLGYAGVILISFHSLMGGHISIGAFAAIFTSIRMMFGMMEQGFSKVGDLSNGVGSAKNYFLFMNLPERNGKKMTADFRQGIQIKDVSYAYPNSKQDCVKNISLDIKHKEVIAIVGENGAGKTTLARLLLGLYIPRDGVVSLFGMDTKKANMQSLYGTSSAIFQDYQRYKMTLRENVWISQTKSDKDVTDAVTKANALPRFSSSNKGIDTMLSRDFGGLDLSGGQWQRIAIARGIYRTHDLIVLDEPTAAIDPIEETNLYNQFVNISKDKTTIIITHRLGSAKIANKIIVMDKGSIVESGSHDELIKNNGLYANMFAIQAGWYAIERGSDENGRKNCL